MFKNKTIKFFIILSVIIFSIVGVIGCSNPTDNDNVNVNATYIEMSSLEDAIDDEFTLVNNYLDLLKILNNDIPEKYNDDFFKTKSLFIFKITEPSGGNKSEIESYEIIDKTLSIYVKTKQYGITEDVGCWVFILELSKDEVNKFKGIRIFKDGEEIMNNEKKLILDYIKYAHSIGLEDVNVENTEILENYGEYNDAVVFRISRPAFQVITYISFLDIGFGIHMQFPDTNTPLVYKNGNFYELKDVDIYKNGILTKENLIELQDKIASR